MKQLHLQAIITSLRAKTDGSLSLSLSTPELTPEEKTLFFQLQNVNLNLTITPHDEEKAPEHTISKDIEQKTQSQRIRNVLFILFKQDPEGSPDFETFYRVKTEKYIEGLKGRIHESV